MTVKTEAEVIFESFCNGHGLDWEKIPEKDSSTPDYVINRGGQAIYFELKQIDSDEKI